MFFYLSKILWFFIDPGNAFLLALLLGLILSATRFRRLGKWIAGLAICAALILTFLPIGPWMLRSLETRFPVPETLPENIDGIVVLGGVIQPKLTALHGVNAIGGAVERITVSARLARAHPGARMIYTGGAGTIRDQDFKEADYVAMLYYELGVAKPQLILEREARNTWENAKYAYDLAAPKPGETWLLVTSAFHMPRAVGVFRRIGWSMVPYPVDFNADPQIGFPDPMSFTSGLSGFSHALHEWIGLAAYWIAGKTGAAFPKPIQKEGT